MVVRKISLRSMPDFSIAALQDAVAYIDWKQGFYNDVLSGKTAYYSNLVPELMK